MRVELAAAGASDAELRDVVKKAEAQSPVNDAVARAVPVTMEVVLGGGGGPASP